RARGSRRATTRGSIAWRRSRARITSRSPPRTGGPASSRSRARGARRSSGATAGCSRVWRPARSAPTRLCRERVRVRAERLARHAERRGDRGPELLDARRARREARLAVHAEADALLDVLAEDGGHGAVAVIAARQA